MVSNVSTPYILPESTPKCSVTLRLETVNMKYLFNHDDYYHTLKGRIPVGSPVFQDSNQRGGGLGSILCKFGRYIIPVTKKYILPHAKEAVLSTLSDIHQNGADVSEALKRNGLRCIKNIGNSVVNSKQVGGNITRKKRGAVILSPIKAKIRKTFRKTKRESNKKKSKKKATRSKTDIFA